MLDTFIGLTEEDKNLLEWDMIRFGQSFIGLNKEGKPKRIHPEEIMMQSNDEKIS